jgi:hypothetical protein
VITAVDPSRETVGFGWPNNAVCTVSPKNEEIASLLRKLKVGTQVDLVYRRRWRIGSRQ